MECRSEAEGCAGGSGGLVRALVRATPVGAGASMARAAIAFSWTSPAVTRGSATKRTNPSIIAATGSAINGLTESVQPKRSASQADPLGACSRATRGR